MSNIECDLRRDLALFADALSWGACDDVRIGISALEHIIMHFDERLSALEKGITNDRIK